MILTYQGVSVFYTDEGNGETLVFLHGFLGNHSMWDFIIPHFKANFRCIAIDLPGHGLTGILDEVHAMDLMADVVLYVLEEMEIASAIFIGHSMGGYVGLAIADKLPSMIKGLCLVNSTGLEDDETRKRLRDRSIAVIKKNKKLYIGMAISNLFAEGNRARFNNEIKN